MYAVVILYDLLNNWQLNLKKRFVAVHSVPELLAPGGSLDKVKIAILYGADAVYVAGRDFGLRAAADNLTNEELSQAVELAHKKNKLIYVVLNSMLHNDQLPPLIEYIKFLSKLKVDAVIASDLGVIELVKKYSSIDIHLSTQASCLNKYSAKAWKEQGVKRIILGREVSIYSAQKIKDSSGIEIEMFIHGSMCIAYSGHCTISNYTAGRDSNRGGCAHNCRFLYSIDSNSRNFKGHCLSSKDLQGIDYVELAKKYGIDSLKIEGRMKGPMYLASTVSVYKKLLNSHSLSKLEIDNFKLDLLKIPNRDYCSGNLLDPAGNGSIYLNREHEIKEYEFCAVVVEVVKDEFLLLDVKNAFETGQQLEILNFDGVTTQVEIEWIKNCADQEKVRTNPSTLVKIQYLDGVKKYQLIRKKI